MPIISTSCKRLLLSSDFDSTFIMHHLTFEKKRHRHKLYCTHIIP
jgi:hypothetical protein